MSSRFSEADVRRDPKGRFAEKPARGGAAGGFDYIDDPEEAAGWSRAISAMYDDPDESPDPQERADAARDRAGASQREATGTQTIVTLAELERDGVGDIIVEESPNEPGVARLVEFTDFGGERRRRGGPGFARGEQRFNDSLGPAIFPDAMREFREGESAVRLASPKWGGTLTVSNADGSNPDFLEF